MRALIWCAVSTTEQAADEKQSLETQERDLRAIASVRGWVVLAALRVPGFSRDYISWEECAADMLRHGITAMADLRAHCEQRDFDVLMVRDADRFGRTQSLVMQVAETSCVRLGLSIYSQMDNQLVSGVSARFWAAMVGLRSAGEQDKRKKFFQDGMNRRAESGKPIPPTEPLSHLVQRDKNGKAIKYVVNETQRRLFSDLAECVLKGIGWTTIPLVLRDTYGHTAPNGQPLGWSRLWRLLHSPPLWGHTARKYKGRHGLWAFDESIPPPPGVTIVRHTHEPMYTGELATRLQNEMRRRHQLVGKANHAKTANPFTGLLICAACGFSMIHDRIRNSGTHIYTCQSGKKRFVQRTRHACQAKPRYIAQSTVQAWLDIQLRAAIAAQDAPTLLKQEAAIPHPITRGK